MLRVDSDQPGHSPILIRTLGLAVCSKGSLNKKFCFLHANSEDSAQTRCMSLLHVRVKTISLDLSFSNRVELLFKIVHYCTFSSMV